MSEKTLLQAKSDAKRSKNYKEFGKTCLALGAHYRGKSILDKAFKEFADIYELSKSFETDKLNEAKVLREMGEIKVEMKEYGEGLRLIKKYLQVSKSINNQLEIQRALTTLGRSYYIYALDLSGDSDKLAKLESADKYSKLAYEAIPTQTSLECSSLERKKMKTVIYTNRFSILSLLGRQKEADEVFSEGEKLMAEAKFINELYRLYDIKVGISEERGDHASALEASTKAFSILEQLKENPGFLDDLYEALRQRARIFFALQDFESAKKPLVQAYKQRYIKSEQWEEICSMLKSTVRILEMKSEISFSEDSMKVSRLNEKIADLCVSHEFHEVAICFYQKALKIAEKDPIDLKRISRLNYSIGQTFEDLGQYETASGFYEKDLKYSQRLKPIESLPSILGLAHCHEKVKYDTESILQLYQKAREIAKSNGSVSKEVDVLNALLDFMSRNSSNEVEIEKLTKEIEKLRGFVDVGSCNEDEEENSDESQSDESIDLEKALEGELETQISEGRSKRKLSKGKFQTKVNPHGESRLHVLCKDPGNASDVAFLIKAGQPVNCKDYAGFTPLHDACVAGILEYVEILVQSGANKNAQNNNGITPLMDACVAGAVDVIEFLLNSGCDPNLRDKHNWNAADHLRSYLETLDSPDEESLKILSILEGIIIEDPKIVKGSKSAVEMIGDSGSCFIENDVKRPTRTTRESRPQLTAKRCRFRSLSDSSSEEDLPKTKTHKQETTRSVKLYTGAIQSLRGFKSNTNHSTQKRIVTNNLRRSLENSSSDDENREATITSGNKRKTPDDQRHGLQKKQRKESDDFLSSFSEEKKDHQDIVSDWLDDDDTFFQQVDTSKFETKSHSMRKGNEVQESTVRECPPVNDNVVCIENEPQNSGFIVVPHQVSKLTRHISSDRPVGNPSKIRVNVSIAGKVMLVPIGLEEKVSDLLTEISNRQFSNSSQRPLLRILTSDGAELHPSDMLCDIFGINCSVINVVVEICGFQSCPMDQIYESFCRAKSDPVLTNVVQTLSIAQTTGIVSFSSGNLTSSSIQHVLKALHNQSVLVELELPGCRLGTDPALIDGLCISLQSLPQLKKLNLSHNGLESNDLQRIADSTSSLGQENSTQVFALTRLDLSFNDLGTDSCQGLLRMISRYPYLLCLDVSFCNLNENEIVTRKNLWLQTFQSGREKSLLTLNVSGNEVGISGLEVILGCLDPSSLTDLDISSCCKNGKKYSATNVCQKISEFVGNGGTDAALRNLNISRNNLSSDSLKDLSKGFYHLARLEHLDLSYNMNLSTGDIVSLLNDIWTHNVPMTKLSVIGCMDLLKNIREIFPVVKKVSSLELLLTQDDEVSKQLALLAIENSATLRSTCSTIYLSNLIS